MNETETIGVRLSRLRERAHLSCYAVDQLAGLQRGHCWQIERGDNAKVSTIRQLSAALGCSVGYLAAGEGPVPTHQAIRTAVKAARMEFEFCRRVMESTS
jgi:transcriptional regulator with XRE-family HTH domain